MALFGLGRPDIDKLKGANHVNGLITALDYKKDPDLRRRAADALGDLGSPRAVDHLILSLIEDPDNDVRDAAQHALVAIGAPAIDPLIYHLQAPAAQETLAAIGAPAVDPLIAVLDQARHLSRGSVSARDYPNEVKVLIAIGRPSIIPLLSTFRNYNIYVDISATMALLEIGASGIDLLIVTLEDPDAHVRDAAEKVLRRLGALTEELREDGRDRAFATLVEALRGSDKDARLNAVRDLRMLDAKRAVEPLINTLDNPDIDVGLAAASALGSIGDTRAVGPLISVLRRSVRSDDSRLGEAAARALGEIGDPIAVDAQSYAIKYGNMDLKRAAVDALGELGDTRGLGPLCDAFGQHVAGAHTILVKWTEKGADNSPHVNRFIYALGDSDADVRLRAAEVLGRFTNAHDSEKPLIVALADPDERVREAAAQALANLRPYG